MVLKLPHAGPADAEVRPLALEADRRTPFDFEVHSIALEETEVGPQDFTAHSIVLGSEPVGPLENAVTPIVSEGQRIVLELQKASRCKPERSHRNLKMARSRSTRLGRLPDRVGVASRRSNRNGR